MKKRKKAVRRKPAAPKETPAYLEQKRINDDLHARLMSESKERDLEIIRHFCMQIDGAPHRDDAIISSHVMSTNNQMAALVFTMAQLRGFVRAVRRQALAAPYGGLTPQK